GLNGALQRREADAQFPGVGERPIAFHLLLRRVAVQADHLLVARGDDDGCDPAFARIEERMYAQVRGERNEDRPEHREPEQFVAGGEERVDARHDSRIHDAIPPTALCPLASQLPESSVKRAKGVKIRYETGIRMAI